MLLLPIQFESLYHINLEAYPIYINKITQIAWQERMQSRSELFLIQVHLYILKTNTEHKKDSMIENSTWPGKGTNQINHNRIEIITGDPDNRINATRNYNVHIADNTHFAHHSYIDLMPL